MVEGYPDNLAGWGAPAIFKRAGRLLGKYFCLLNPFIAAFFLPVVVIEHLQLWALRGESHPHPHLHHPFGCFYRAFYNHSHEEEAQA